MLYGYCERWLRCPVSFGNNGQLDSEVYSVDSYGMAQVVVR